MAEHTESLAKFRALPENNTEIGKKIGATKALVGKWRAGKVLPGPDYRKRIHEAYGIDPDGWSVVAGSPPPAAAPPPAASSLESVGMVAAVIADLNAQLQTPGLTRDEKNRLNSLRNAAVVQHTKIRSLESVRESRLVIEHPHFRVVMRAIVRALEPFPEAHAAVVAVLEGGP